MRSAANPLVDDGFIDLVLHDLVDVQSLLSLPAYQEHDRESIELYMNAIRRFSRERLFPTYRAMQNEPPELLPDGRVRTHDLMPALWSEMVELGLLTAARPESVGGQQLPTTVHALASTYLMAGNLSAIGFIWLTTGAAHLIEAFGPDSLRERFMSRMYAGEWSGTMALTEPHAGSSLGDVTTKATPTDAPDGRYLIKGSKIFISGGDHSVVDNVVHLALARIEGAPAGSKGISLFAIPRLRESDSGALQPNDVRVSQVIHKIGWKGMPSVALEFGDEGDCRGWLVGEPNQGLRHMFQMMNEARIMVGANGAATASAAYHEALRYARDRTQGRTIHDPKAEQPAPIIEHSDVRRMLLRQKSIVEGSIALVAVTGRYADEAEHAEDSEARGHAQLLLDLLTPVTKTLPAEKGFEANALAVQVHGGYGYTSEFLVESYLRDQKLNTIHEGTTGIQSMDLLGRKVMAKGGAALRAFAAEVQKALSAASEAGVEQRLIDEVRDALETTADLTMTLGKRGMERDMDGMLSHSVDYLELFGALVLGWIWLRLLTIAERKLAAGAGEAETAKLEGVRCAGQYWIRTEVPRVATLAQLCRDAEDSYVRMRPEWFG